jgi:hypothetical protein
MRIGRVLAVGLLGVGSWMTLPAAHAAETSLHADMTGPEETNPPGPKDGKGTADIKLDDAKNEVCYQLKYTGITHPTLAHIHSGAKGVGGPVAVDLNYPQHGDQGCVPADPTVLTKIRDNPGGFYVNIHTADFPNGAIRGQLQKP